MKTITNENYYQDTDYVTNSMLGYLNISEEHLIAYLKKEYTEIEALTFGSAYHCLVLTPQDFANKYAIKPFNLRGDKAKDFYAEAEKENKTVLSTPDYDLICNMVEVLYSYNEIKELIEKSEVEKIFTGEIDEITAKSKQDGHISGTVLWDLKSTRDLANFNKSIELYNYDRQIAFYDMLNSCEKHLFIVQEKQKPYLVGIVKITDKTITKGKMKVYELIKKYKNFKQEYRLEHRIIYSTY